MKFGSAGYSELKLAFLANRLSSGLLTHAGLLGLKLAPFLKIQFTLSATRDIVVQVQRIQVVVEFGVVDSIGRRLVATNL